MTAARLSHNGRGNGELTRITKMTLEGEYISESDYEDIVGHQGLTVDEEGFFWSTSYTTHAQGAGR